MSFNVTNQDRKAAKSTCIVFAVLLAIFACLSVVFGVLIPRTEEIKALGESQEAIRSQVESKDGDDYFLMTDNTLYRYNSVTGEEISTFSLLSIEEMLKRDGKYDGLIAGSLKQWSVTCIDDMDTAYYIVYDASGNIFRLTDDGKNLSLSDDYHLATSKTVIKGSDNLKEDLYLFAQNKNLSYVQKMSVTDLKAGVQQSKFVWDLDLSDAKVGYKKISPMPATTGILGFNVTEDGIYVFRTGGSVVKIGLDMVDAVIDGEKVNFFDRAESYYGGTQYQTAYDEAYREFFLKKMRAKLNTVEESVKAEYPDEKLNAATVDELKSYYKAIGGTITANMNAQAEEEAIEKASEGFFAANPWCDSYDKATSRIVIADEYFDKTQYSVIYSGNNTINGIIYSDKNKAVYFTNAADGYLYVVEKADLDNADIGSFLSTISKKIETVSAGDKRFSTFGNGLGYNKFANTLYLKFENERTLSIVDINDKENYKIAHTFVGSFDMFSIIGNKDNSVTNVLHQIMVVGLDGIPSTHLYACTYQPERFENKTATTWAFVLSLAFAVICFGVGLWFFLAVKSDRVLYKVQVIQRDFKKNKYVYLSLVFFVVLLGLFCYYEAIGAISMSFFNYTREKPAWIWNNFGNYLRIFNQPDFLLSVGNMLFFLVTDLILCIVPPLVFAFLLILIRNKTTSNWIRSLMFIPGIIPSMASMLIWREGIYGTDGVMNQILAWFGRDPIAFLDNTDYARWSLILMGFPFVGGYLIFYGGMMNIPHEYHEAGWLEGLGVTKRFLLIDIPLIAPQIKYVFIMTFINSVQNYARTYILGSAGTITVVESMYRIMTGAQADYGMASAYATIIFLFLFVAVATNFKMQKKETMGDDL